MKKISSLSTFSLQVRYGDEEAIKIAGEIGAKAIDFSTFKLNDCRKPETVYGKGEGYVIEYYSRLRELADGLGVKICQTHGQVSGFDRDPEHNEAILKNARLDLLAAKALGSPVSVMHSVTTIRMGPDCPRETMQELNYSMFMQIAEMAKTEGILLATETFGDAPKFGCCDFFGNIDEFEESYLRVRNSGFEDTFKICIDTGHSNKAMRFGNPTPANVIRRLGRGGDIVCLHLNDNDTLTDQHKIPCTGCIAWNDVFDALDEVGYSGYYNMEVVLGKHFGENFLREEAEFAVKVMDYLLNERYGV